MQRTLSLRLLAGILIFGLILSQVDIREAGRVLSDANATPLVGVMLLNLPILLLALVRSALILRRLGHKPPRDVLLSTVTVGYVAGAFTPLGSGELLRIQSLQLRGGVPARVGTALIAFERVLSFYLLCLSALAAAALMLLPWEAAVLVFCTLIGMTTMPALAQPLLGLIPEPPPDAIGLRARASRLMQGLARDLGYLLHDRLLLVSVSLISIAIFSLVALQFWLLAEAVGANVGFGVAWLAFGTAQIAGIASALPFGIGVFDGSLAGVLASFGASADQGLAVALLVRMTVNLPLIIVAIVAYAYLMLPGRSSAINGRLSAEES